MAQSILVAKLSPYARKAILDNGSIGSVEVGGGWKGDGCREGVFVVVSQVVKETPGYNASR